MHDVWYRFSSLLQLHSNRILSVVFFTLPRPEMNILLQGIVGSQAYGLAHEDSDIDQLGLFAAPTEQFHGLIMPKEHIVTTNPDIKLYEARKYCQLALKCNPSILELMWLEDYLIDSPAGIKLLNIREHFLSKKYVRDAYLGYATQQFRKLTARGDGSFSSDTRKRTAKHARHLYRLLHQGLTLYTTGNIVIALANPTYFIDFGEQVANGDIELARTKLSEYEQIFNSSSSPLADSPNTKEVDAWLTWVRWIFNER